MSNSEAAQGWVSETQPWRFPISLSEVWYCQIVSSVLTQSFELYRTSTLIPLLQRTVLPLHHFPPLLPLCPASRTVVRADHSLQVATDAPARRLRSGVSTTAPSHMIVNHDNRYLLLANPVRPAYTVVKHLHSGFRGVLDTAVAPHVHLAFCDA
jgi:hypothetical protein